MADTAYAKFVSTDRPAKCRPNAQSVQANAGEPELPPSVVASWPNTHRRLSPGERAERTVSHAGCEPLTPYTFPNRVRVTQAQSTPSMVPDSYTGWAG
jgi:hypothetical protein